MDTGRALGGRHDRPQPGIVHRNCPPESHAVALECSLQDSNHKSLIVENGTSPLGVFYRWMTSPSPILTGGWEGSRMLKVSQVAAAPLWEGGSCAHRAALNTRS